MEAIIARSVQILLALGGAYLLALWFALVVWTFQDIQRRSRSVIAQIFSTLVVVLFFLPGVLIYLILRPRDTLDDAFQRSLEEEYLLQDLEELPLCYNCQRYVDEDYVYCPHCRVELRQDCTDCGRLIDLRWDICPYCGTEQYPEEPAAAIDEVDDWDRLPAGGVSRFSADNPRGRLAGRRAVDADTGYGTTELTAPMPSRGEVGDGGWAPAASSREDPWGRHDNGADAYPSRWDDLPVDDEDERGRTEELPTDPLHRKR